MTAKTKKSKAQSQKPDRVKRISVSLPESLFGELDRMVQARGYQSRSQAISEMISDHLIEHQQKYGDNIMAGTISLVYQNTRKDLLSRLKEIQLSYITEIISSLHVHLENRHSLEVLLVQGPAARLKKIADELITCKGVVNGKLNITSTVMPPIY